MRFGILISVLCLACAPRNATPSSQSCGVLNAPSQLDGCVGKAVTIRGKVTGTPKPSIIGVDVDAGPDLFEKWGHAIGTLEKSGAGFALKDAGVLAKVHATSTPGK